MKKITTALVFALIIMSTLVFGATSLSVDPSSYIASVGETFELSIEITTDDSIAGGQLSINYDPAVIEALMVEDGNFLTNQGDGLFGIFDVIDNSAGKIMYGTMTMANNKGFNGTGSFVDVTFRAIATDSSTDITIEDVVLGDAVGSEVITSVNNGVVNVVPIQGDIYITEIPDIVFDEDTMTSIDLDNHILDKQYSASEITWTHTTASNIAVAINAATHVMTIIPDSDWYSSRQITLTATNPAGNYSTRDVMIIVENVNDAPVFDNLDDVTFDEGTSKLVDLDDYADDIDNPDSALIFSYAANANINVDIDLNHVATFTSIDPDWYGVETIVFTVEDPDGETDTATALVTVNQLFDDLPYIESSLPAETEQLIGDGWELDAEVTVANPDGMAYGVLWYVDGVYESSGNSIVFESDVAGIFELLADVTDSITSFDTAEWEITVTTVPVTEDYDGTITSVTESDVENFAGLTIENEFGMIEFEDPIDLSEVVDVDSNVDIRSGVAGINSDSFGFDVFKDAAATITLYDLNVSEPVRIYYAPGFSASERIVCPESICSNVEYDPETATVTFDVSGFSLYMVSGRAPVADAGEDITGFKNEFITLDGSGSYDPDTDPITYLWTQVSGPAVTLNSNTAVDPSFTPDTSGEYVFNLVVNDGYLNSTPDNVTVQIYHSGLEITSVKLSSEGDNDELKPGEALTVKAKIKNTGETDIEDVEVMIWFEDSNGNKLEDDDGDDIEDDDGFDLDEGDSETVEFKFTAMPMDVEDGDKYWVHIEVTGTDAEDENINYRAIDESEKIEFVREKHEVQIYKAELIPDSIKCTRKGSIDVLIRNLGEEEEEVSLAIMNRDIGLLIVDNFELSDDLEDEESRMSETYLFSISDGIDAGVYPVELVVGYGSKSERTVMNLEVVDCIKEVVLEESEETYTEKEKTGKELTSEKEEPTEKQVIVTDFRDTTTYAVLLGITSLLLLGLIIVIIVVVVIQAKRKGEEEY